MAVGEVVSDMFSVATDFQPAVGVSIMITQFLCWNDPCNIRGRGDIDTGAFDMAFTSSTGTSTSMNVWNGFVHKFPINNSSYLHFIPTTTPGNVGFSGIQIK